MAQYVFTIGSFIYYNAVLHFPTEVLIVTLNSAKQSVELALKEISEINTKVVGVPDDSEFDTADCLIHVKDHIKVNKNMGCIYVHNGI